MRRTSMLAAMSLATIAGMEMAAAAMPTPRKGSARVAPRRQVAVDTPDLKREIAAHNAEVERRKAEKRARKLAR